MAHPLLSSLLTRGSLKASWLPKTGLGTETRVGLAPSCHGEKSSSALSSAWQQQKGKGFVGGWFKDPAYPLPHCSVTLYLEGGEAEARGLAPGTDIEGSGHQAEQRSSGYHGPYSPHTCCLRCQHRLLQVRRRSGTRWELPPHYSPNFLQLTGWGGARSGLARVWMMPLTAMMSHMITWLTTTAPGACRRPGGQVGERARAPACRGGAVTALTMGTPEVLSGPRPPTRRLRPKYVGSKVLWLALVLRSVALEACSSRSAPLSVCGQTQPPVAPGQSPKPQEPCPAQIPESYHVAQKAFIEGHKERLIGELIIQEVQEVKTPLGGISIAQQHLWGGTHGV